MATAAPAPAPAAPAAGAAGTPPAPTPNPPAAASSAFGPYAPVIDMLKAMFPGDKLGALIFNFVLGTIAALLIFHPSFVPHTDRAIGAYRRLLFKAIDDVENGRAPLFAPQATDNAMVTGPVTVDGISATGSALTYPTDADARRRKAASWQVRR